MVLATILRMLTVCLTLKHSSAWNGASSVLRARTHPAIFMRDDGYFFNGPQASPERNQGGERVIRQKRTVAEPSSEADGSTRRTLLLGLLGAGAWYTSINVVSQKSQQKMAKTVLYDDGDAVTAPALELQLQDLLAGNSSYSQVQELVQALEQTGGPTLAASAPQGRWVLPWVGGWERVWTTQQDASNFGGPARASLGSRAALQLSSARQFVYGPGEGGITVEYLFTPPSTTGAANKAVLLARQGAVSNLGGNFFQLDFPTPLQPYELEGGSSQQLTPLPALPTSEGAPPASGLTMQTTYLSGELWILRSYTDPTQVSVFQRTETRSVLDRRGLVAEGQLKPPDDETIRYGRLLFGETLSDYAGWSDAAQADANQKQKLLSR